MPLTETSVADTSPNDVDNYCVKVLAAEPANTAVAQRCTIDQPQLLGSVLAVVTF